MGMTSYERVMTAISLREPDRVPVIPRAKGFSVKYAGAKVWECFEEPDKFIAAQMRFVRDFGFDAVIDLYSGVPLYNEFLGGELVFSPGLPPSAPPVFSTIRDFSKVSRIDLTQIKRMAEICRMVERLKQEVRDDIPTIIGLPGVFRSAALLRGLQEFYTDLVKHPAFVRDLLDFCLEMTMVYAALVIDAGADIIFTSNSVASRNCISRRHYEKFVTDDEKKLNALLKAKGKKVMHHTCGDWNDRFDLVVAEGVDIVFASAQADLAELKAAYGDRVSLMGNIDSVGTMFSGTPEQVEAESVECMRKAAKGGGFILSGDCELPPETPIENMKALGRTARNAGTYPLAL